MEKDLKKILLVEDSEDDVFFLKRAFKNAGVTNPVKVCMDGQAAIDHLASITTQEAPLIMLLDLKLPRKNGFEVLQWVRTQSAFPNTVVVILTSSFEPADLDRAYKLGTNAYLTKVSDGNALESIVFGLKDFWLRHNHFPINV